MEAVSPELILVSPPEVAAAARALLPDYATVTVRAEVAPSRFGFMCFAFVCLVMTLGPVVLTIARAG